MSRIRRYSWSEIPCSATSSGVMAGSPGRGCAGTLVSFQSDAEKETAISRRARREDGRCGSPTVLWVLSVLRAVETGATTRRRSARRTGAVVTAGALGGGLLVGLVLLVVLERALHAVAHGLVGFL